MRIPWQFGQTSVVLFELERDAPDGAVVIVMEKATALPSYPSSFFHTQGE